MASRWRHWPFRLLALIFAASWITFPGWAAPDLIASWSPDWRPRARPRNAPVLAGLSRQLRRLLAICAGTAAAYLGLVSATEARLGLGWAIAAIAWGIAVAAAGLAPGQERRLVAPRSVDSAIG